MHSVWDTANEETEERENRTAGKDIDRKEEIVVTVNCVHFFKKMFLVTRLSELNKKKQRHYC